MQNFWSLIESNSGSGGALVRSFSFLCLLNKMLNTSKQVQRVSKHTNVLLE